MVAREKRILDLAEELLRKYPNDFTPDYAKNMERFHRSQYFDGPVSAQTFHKVAGTVAHRVKLYESLNPDWREEMANKGYVTSNKSDRDVAGSRSAGRPKKTKRFFPKER
jgi:ribosomal protein S17E